MPEILHRNDTYGDLTGDELTELRACAETCVCCGMAATVDPVFHAARYGHAPVILRNGVRHRWHERLFCWEAE